MPRYKILIFFLLLLSFVKVRAQYDAAFSHYWSMQPFYNPASAGKDSKIHINAAYAMSLVGFTNNPKTMYIGADMPFYFLKTYHGVGLGLVNDQIGLFKHQNINVAYSFGTRLWGGMLRLGVQAGMITENYDGSKLDVEDANDKALVSSSLTGHGLDIGVGLYYMYKDWYGGFSSQHVNAPLVGLGETNEISIGRSYYFLGGGNIKLNNPFFTIQPSVILRTDFVAYKPEITARVVYTNESKRLEGGLSVSPGTSVTLLVGGDFHGINLGYSYEAYTSALSVGNGSHEIKIGYDIDVNLFKKGKNLHKSVRLL